MGPGWEKERIRYIRMAFWVGIWVGILYYLMFIPYANL